MTAVELTILGNIQDILVLVLIHSMPVIGIAVIIGLPMHKKHPMVLYVALIALVLFVCGVGVLFLVNYTLIREGMNLAMTESLKNMTNP